MLLKKREEENFLGKCRISMREDLLMYEVSERKFAQIGYLRTQLKLLFQQWRECSICHTAAIKN